MSFNHPTEVKEEPLEEVEVKEEEDDAFLKPPPSKKVKRKTSGGGGGDSSKKKVELSEEEKRRKKAEYDKQRRKKITEDPAKHEAIKKRNAELARLRRARLKEQLSPEELDELRKNHSENKKRLRMAYKTEEEREEIRRKAAEKRRERRRRNNCEETRRRNNFQNFVRKAMMTEEEREAEKMKRYLYQKAWYANRGRWRDRPEEEKEKKRRQWREWTTNLSGEKRERHKESVKRAVKKYQEKMKVEEPGKYYGRVYFDRMKIEQPEKWRERYEKQLQYLRTQYANETPEQRKRRQFKEKVNGARRRQRKRLEGEGVRKEEIERRDQELKVRMWKEFDPEGEVPPNKPGKRVRVAKASVRDEAAGTSSGMISLWSCGSQMDVRVHDETNPSGSHDFCAPSSPPSPPTSPANYMDHSEDFDGFGDTPAAAVEEEADDPVITSLQCPHSILQYSFDTDLTVHIRSRHPEKCYKCPKCGELMTSPQQLSQHYQASHKKTETSNPPHPPPSSDLNFFCMRCCVPPTPPSDQSYPHLTGFKSRSELVAHVKTKHPENYWPCDHCHLLKYSERALQLHLSVCRLNKERGQQVATEKKKGKRK